ncbi:MAG: PQQ-dependent dehydrogenase, methanol/ethanol family, partial [Deltaproteobacteria bacterium]|nr:PQQ-dependent dehydrogenase, methanol/ethanol family [Deltaproteobacteria bacterium]
MSPRPFSCIAIALLLASCHAPTAREAAPPRAEDAARAATAGIDDARLRAAAGEPRNWLTHGGTYAEQRYSPLEQITADNVGQLGLAWFYDTHTNRGLEATPLVADGVLYTTG